MGNYIPPASAGVVAPQTPAQGVVIGSPDQLSFDYLIGKVLIGGSQFSDTLGRFYPFIVNAAKSLVVNASNANLYGIRFHNTAATLTDEVIYFGDSQALFIVPDSSTSVNTPLIIADRTTSAYFGYVIYPNSGLTPSTYVTFSGGVGTLQWYNGVFHGYQFITDYYANQVYISGNIAGQQPGMVAVGSDTNIDLFMVTKGTGVMIFGYASDALGGGVAPTLGTIGGTGPATAAQNAWLRVKINGQTAYWIPVWR